MIAEFSVGTLSIAYLRPYFMNRKAMTISIGTLMAVLAGAAEPPATPVVDTADSAAHLSNGMDANTMDEVVVTGEWPGPQMWKISKGDHVVWILGTLQPLPKEMIWKQIELDRVLMQSQQVIGRTSVKPKVSIFGLLPLYLQFRKVSKLPGDQTLKDILPPELYQRYRALLTQYHIHDNDLEKLRPLIAAGRLYQDVIEANGLTGKNDVQEAVIKLANHHDIPVNDITIKVEEPKEVLKDVAKVPPEGEVACFADVLSGLETELPMLKKRASSWARGDVDTLRKLVAAQTHTACRDAMLSVERVRAVSDHAKSSWYNAITESLDRYKSAVALSPVYDLIGKDGALDQLRAAGYQVEGP
jgi:uncharacterized protein YbaP (TraB family)